MRDLMRRLNLTYFIEITPISWNSTFQSAYDVAFDRFFIWWNNLSWFAKKIHTPDLFEWWNVPKHVWESTSRNYGSVVDGPSRLDMEEVNAYFIYHRV